MVFISFFIIHVLFVAAEDFEYCDASKKTCNTLDDKKLILYDVNPPEGFNLRRDVYMRFAIMLAEAQKQGKRTDYRLVLPPWHNLYHWKTTRDQRDWGSFFDVDSLKTYAKVLEMYEVMANTHNNFSIDTLYVLQNFEDAFEGGTFKEKWELSDSDCYYNGFWGYNNITVKEKICVRFQGQISKLWELVALHPTDTKIMFAHGEIPLHDSYGSKSYWDCRKSMKFSKILVDRAIKYVYENFKCGSDKCDTYLSIHWRRQDFVYGRKDQVPSVKSTAKQIDETVKKNKLKIDKIFVATDASDSEIKKLIKGLESLTYNVFLYVPSRSELVAYGDGGVAIVEQMICAHSSFFIGTHESTFTFRIQEEREILGFGSESTFNRLCPDSGPCERPSTWRIVQ